MYVLSACVYLWCACVCVSSSWARVLSFTWMWFMWSVSNLLPQVLFVHTLCTVCMYVCVCETLSLWNYRVVRCAPHVTTDVVLLLAVVVAVLAAKWHKQMKVQQNKERRQSKAMTTMHFVGESGGRRAVWHLDLQSQFLASKPYVGHVALGDWIVNSISIGFLFSPGARVQLGSPPHTPRLANAHLPSIPCPPTNFTHGAVIAPCWRLDDKTCLECPKGCPQLSSFARPGIFSSPQLSGGVARRLDGAPPCPTLA